MSNTSLLGSYGAQDNSSIMFRNKLYNGCFRVWQRGTSQTSSGYGSDDRWVNENALSTKTHSQQPFALGQTEVSGNPEYFSRTVVSSVAGASNYVAKYQKIESVRTLSGQTATLSFWAKADAPKNMAVEFVQIFGTGGSPSAPNTAIGVTTIALTTSWKYYTVTVNVPSIAGKTLGTNNNDYLQLIFWFDAGSNLNARTNSLGSQSGTFDIAQVQLEAGPVATPFEHRPVGLELSLCQRYYEKSYDLDTAPGTSTSSGCCRSMTVTTNSGVGLVFAPFKVTKRANPANTVYTAGGAEGSLLYRVNEAAAATTTVSDAGEGGVISASFFKTGLTANARFYTEFHWTADAEL